MLNLYTYSNHYQSTFVYIYVPKFYNMILTMKNKTLATLTTVDVMTNTRRRG